MITNSQGNASILIFAAVCLFAGCVNTDVVKLSSAPENLSPTSSSNVEVYRDTTTVECPYKGVAVIDTRGTSSTIDNDDMVESAKETTAELGGNGLVLKGFETAEIFLGTEPKGKYLAIYEERPC